MVTKRVIVTRREEAMHGCDRRGGRGKWGIDNGKESIEIKWQSKEI